MDDGEDDEGGDDEGDEEDEELGLGVGVVGAHAAAKLLVWPR